MPYRLAWGSSSSLWDAVGVLQVFHALVAPLTFLVVLRLRSMAVLAATLAGLVVALDGGLLDTARSGAESYFSPLWVGVLLFARLNSDRVWGPGLAWGALAMAVMNHPLAICAVPFLWGLPLRTHPGRVGLLIGGLMLAPHALGGMFSHSGGSGGLELGAVEALDAWLKEGGVAAWVLMLAPICALARPKSRWIGGATLASLVILFGLGMGLGYLRDHHLRILTIPFAACLVALPGRWVLLVVLALRIPDAKVQPEGVPPRPGTLGMTTGLAAELLRADLVSPFYVDGAWVSGGLVAEPSAVMLDLHLRGIPLEKLGAGGDVAVLVSSRRGELGKAPKSKLLSRGDHHWLVLNPEPLPLFCEQGVRLGGAWDFMALAHPQQSTESLNAWYPSCVSD